MAPLATLWGKTRRYRGWIVICLIFLFLILILAGYVFNWVWTGFNPSVGPKVKQYQPGRTLWDWLQLLLVPLLLTLGVAWFAGRQNHDREIALAQQEHDRELAREQREESALQTYIDHMSELLLEKKLRTSTEDDDVRKIATARTLTLLPHLDAQRKRSVLKFLHESHLIEVNTTLVNLMDADLSGADLGVGEFSRPLNLVASELTFVDLSGANLRGAKLRGSSLLSSVLYDADLSGADLSDATLFMTNFIQAKLVGAELNKATLVGAWLKETDLTEADLKEANLFQADLTNANLSSAKMDGADLGEANLTGATITQEQLQTAKSLKDAIMPDGTKHS